MIVDGCVPLFLRHPRSFKSEDGFQDLRILPRSYTVFDVTGLYTSCNHIIGKDRLWGAWWSEIDFTQGHSGSKKVYKLPSSPHPHSSSIIQAGADFTPKLAALPTFTRRDSGRRPPPGADDDDSAREEEEGPPSSRGPSEVEPGGALFSPVEWRNKKLRT